MCAMGIQRLVLSLKSFRRSANSFESYRVTKYFSRNFWQFRFLIHVGNGENRRLPRVSSDTMIVAFPNSQYT